jgi:outer membrane cobalamin receptor
MYGTAFLAPSPYEAYSHYGSFVSADGGATYASGFWHLPNPALRPQKKQTVEMSLTQSLGELVAVSASAFYSSFTDLLKNSDADQSHAGVYHGWPVSYIETFVNEGRARTYGGTAGIDAVRVFAFDRRVAMHAAVSIADGRVWEVNGSPISEPIGGMVPLQFKSGADVDWGGWSLAPRVTVEGRQRVIATVLSGGSMVRRTLPGYAVVDVNVRRRSVTRHADLFLTVENALGARYRNINRRAYTNPEELIGAPQNPRRLTVGVDVQLWGR